MTELFEAFLDSWERNNRILVNLLRALPAGGLEARARAGSPTVGEMIGHMHYVRLVLVSEDAPECAREMPADEWAAVRDVARMAEMLNESARGVREAVVRRMESGREMDVHYDHPILMMQHLIWHEGYHHGQIKLALLAAGLGLDDREAGRVTWHVWFDKS